jgi:hypothetical protein
VEAFFISLQQMFFCLIFGTMYRLHLTLEADSALPDAYLGKPRVSTCNKPALEVDGFASDHGRRSYSSLRTLQDGPRRINYARQSGMSQQCRIWNIPQKHRNQGSDSRCRRIAQPRRMEVYVETEFAMQ